MNQGQALALPVPRAALDFCRAQGFGAVQMGQPLTGGVISVTRRLSTSSGASLILKQTAQPPPELYACEARGLQALKAAGMHTPEVLTVGGDFLLLEDLGSAPKEALDWAALGRAVGLLHQHTDTQFGLEYDNYLGLLPQWNPRMDDGHEYFARCRVLRYLGEPLCEQTLTSEDRRRLERLMTRLPLLIPAQPPSLLHGDLWQGNILLGAEGRAALIDPAVNYGWPEAELSMVRQCGGVPSAFFDAYVEVHPLAEGWWERLEIMFIREILSTIAHLGNWKNALSDLRAILDKFA